LPSSLNRADLPKFAANNRNVGTPEENKAIVQGSFAYFGTYTVTNKFAQGIAANSASANRSRNLRGHH
jgi:hypothetical protein